MTPLRRSGFTLLELQVSIVVIAIGIVSVTSVMATEKRMLKRLHAGLKPAGTASVAKDLPIEMPSVVAGADAGVAD